MSKGAEGGMGARAEDEIIVRTNLKEYLLKKPSVGSSLRLDTCLPALVVIFLSPAYMRVGSERNCCACRWFIAEDGYQDATHL